MNACMCVCVQMTTHICGHPCGDQMSTPDVIPQNCPPCVVETVLLIGTWGSPYAWLAGLQIPRIFLSLPPQDWITSTGHHTQLFVWMVRMTFRSWCVCSVSAVLTEPSKPHTGFLYCVLHLCPASFHPSSLRHKAKLKHVPLFLYKAYLPSWIQKHIELFFLFLIQDLTW